MSNGMSVVEVITRIHPVSAPYVGRRLDPVLSLQVLSSLPDFPARPSETAEEWLQESRERLLVNLGKLRAAAFLIVFGVISAVILAMHSIQNQIALDLQ